MSSLCCTGLSREAKNDIKQFFVNKGVVSPSDRDTIRLRNERGNLILIEEINSDEKYEEIGKLFYTENDVDLYQEWLYENVDLLRRERLAKQQPLISRKTFTNYKPNYVQKTSYLSQFACTIDTEFDWIHATMMKTLQDNHECGDPNKCTNFAIPMGTRCTCDRCSGCIISELAAIPPKQLLHQLCCNSADETVPYLDCVKGECFMSECFSDKIKRILTGGGCDTLNVNDEKIIYYYKLVSFTVNGKSKKCKARVPSVWSNFKQKYVELLEEYLYHRYVKEWQQKQRYNIEHRINNTVALPENALFGSFDYGGNIICAYKTHPHNGTMVEISIISIYQIININGE